MEFTWLEKIQSVAFLSSFVTIVLKSITWHHLDLAKEGSLAIGQKMMVAPFFLTSILMKCFVPGTIISLSICLGYQSLALIVLIFTLLVYQVTLHKIFGIKNKQVIIASIANLTSLARPVTETGFIQTWLVKSFFMYETVISTFIYLLISSIAIAVAKSHQLDEIAIWLGMGFTLLHLLITQVYLHTEQGQILLFPNTATPSKQAIQLREEKQPAKSQQGSQCLPTKKKLKTTGWIFFITSLALTLGVFSILGYQLYPGKIFTYYIVLFPD